MKVGTDGTLLGAWAKGGETILDAGTGTGLIALMMAQRYPEARVLGIDIDSGAVEQAQENVADSPFASRIMIAQQDLRTLEGRFDAIVSNPPYFHDSLKSPDQQRTLARHTSQLTYRELMTSAFRLLDEKGEFSLIIPFDCKPHLEAEAALAGFFKCRECAVKTTPRKAPRRYLISFAKHAPASIETTEGVIELQPHQHSQWYQGLMQEFLNGLNREGFILYCQENKLNKKQGAIVLQEVICMAD